MDPKSTDKFAELSPVLELIYVMLTNMAKYMDVYAADIEAEKTEQYREAREAMALALKKFDALYGLTSTGTDQEEVATDVSEMDTDDALPAEAETVSSEVPSTGDARQDTETLSPEEPPALEKADPESLQKAKEAVDELKTLFADMKRQENAAATPEPAVEPVQAPVSSEPTPSFVAPAPSPETVTENAQMEEVANLPVPNGQAPSPTQDSNEVESILEELKKLQNKGTDQTL